LNSMVCPVCGGQASLRYPDHPGYQEPDTFGIYHCGSCNTSFADPLKVDGQLYELIYAHHGQIPGYDRYFKYASAALKSDDPLSYLAASEDAYWAINKFIEENGKAASRRFLEVGSGLGYLTYALSRRGIDITGLDISCKAVERATAMYGGHYICKDLFELSRTSPKSFDVIISSEVIEHMPEVGRFFEAVDALLADGGELAITTPSRTLYDDSVLWETEGPPVHLWWFSERSMEALASKFGYVVRFIDFTEFNKTHPLNIWKRQNPHLPTRPPVFREDGGLNLGMRTSTVYYAAKACLRAYRTGMAMASSYILGNKESRRGTLCAVFKKNG